MGIDDWYCLICYRLLLVMDRFILYICAGADSVPADKCYRNRERHRYRLKNKLDSLFFNRQFESEPQICLERSREFKILGAMSSQQAALTWRIT